MAPFSRRRKRIVAIAASACAVLIVFAGLSYRGPAREPIENETFQVESWEYEEDPVALRYGKVVAMAQGDLDRDGTQEVITVGTYSYGIGDIRVFSHRNGTLALVAATRLTQPAAWDLSSILISDVDNDHTAEIIVGGTLFLGYGPGVAAFHVLKVTEGELVGLATVWWAERSQQASVLSLLSPSRFEAEGTVLVTLSSEVWETESDTRFLRGWALNQSDGQLRETFNRSVPSDVWTAISYPCNDSFSSPEGLVLLGYEAIHVLAGALATQENGYPTQRTIGFAWDKVSCVEVTGGSLVIGVGPGTMSRGLGMVTFILRAGSALNLTPPLNIFSVGSVFSGDDVRIYPYSEPAIRSSGSDHVVIIAATRETLDSSNTSIFRIGLDNLGKGQHPKGSVDVLDYASVTSAQFVDGNGDAPSILVLGGKHGKDPAVFVVNEG